jgi:hypothetical protein
MEISMKIVVRNPGPKFKSRVGEVTPHGLKVVSFVGFGVTENHRKTSFSVYEVLCPHCNKTSQMWGNCISRNKSCGCVDWLAQPPIHHAMRTIWTREKAYLCDRWKDWDLFYSDLSPKWFPNAKIFAKDRTQPLSPDNYEFLDSGKTGKNARAFGIRITVNGQVFVMAQIARILGVSRQRVHQMSRDVLIERLKIEISRSSANKNATVNGV